MKRKLLILVEFLLYVPFMFGQWVETNPGNTFLDKLDCADGTHCYLVGMEGNLRKTIDGTNWTDVSNGIGATIDFFELQVISQDTVYAYGNDGGADPNFNKYYDGGNNWTQVLLSGIGLGDMNFINSSVGFAVGDNNAIYSTVNKGDTWTLAGTISGYFNAIDFYDENFGVAGANTQGTTNKRQIYKTTNGGQNWSLVYETDLDNEVFWDIQMVTDQVGYASGMGGNIVKTINGGDSWSEVANPYEGVIWFKALDFIDAMNGYVVGNGGTILKTVNGGNSWIDESGAYGPLVDVSIGNSDTVYIGFSGQQKVYKNTDANLSIMEGEKIIGKVYPNPAKELLQVQIEKSGTTLYLFDILGNQLLNQDLSNYAINQINLSDFRTGVYLYEIREDNRLINTGKLVKQ